MILATFQTQAEIHFPQTTIEQTATASKKQKATWKKHIKKRWNNWRQRVRSKNIFGKIAFYGFLTASVLNFSLTSLFAAGLISATLLTSFLAAIIGSLGGDENRKRAKMTLLIFGLIFSIVLGWTAILML